MRAVAARGRYLRASFALAPLVVCACTEPVASLGGLVETTGTSGGAEELAVLGTSPPRGVDVLVVVDNTVGMAQEQAALSLALGDLIAGLAAVNDVRVSFTTTDGGNPACVGTTPEGGALSILSCRERLAEFAAGDPVVDESAVGCLDVCGLESVALLPTADGLGAEPAVRPWIQSVAGVRNTEAELREAVACATPQGLRGCEFEQPLEAMRSALLRSLVVGEAAEGFVRPDAALAVVILTNEVDCSYDPARQEAFAAEGSQVFWTNPGEAAPTSAACWNAGVACAGGDTEQWAECTATDKRLDGQASAVDAVLFPLWHYADLFTQLAALKAPYLADSPMGLYVIAGVPSGYQAGTTPLSFPKNPDPEFAVEYGVGAACGVGAERAVPAVRLRELAENYGDLLEGRVSSICEPSYAAALDGLGAIGTPTLAPLCYPGCVADLDPDIGGLQPDCLVQQEYGSPAGRVTATVPACGGTPAAPEIPEGTDVCWYARTDSAATTEPDADDLDTACIAAERNLQVQIVRAGGTLELGGTSTLARCTPC